MPESEMWDTGRALASLGVSRDGLSSEERRQLDEEGFLPIPGALSPEETLALRSLFDAIVAAEGDRAGIEVSQEEGAPRLANLVDKDPRFDLAWNHPRQLAAVAHVLGWHEFKLCSLNGRAALLGHGQQSLHTDLEPPPAPGDYQICNSIWMLDDFTEDNGPTRVVPGSHRWPRLPKDDLPDLRQPHPQEIHLDGSAGTCVVFNGHLWHGGTLNRSGAPRRALHGAFTRRHQPQETVQADYLRPETLRRLSPAQRYLLEV